MRRWVTAFLGALLGVTSVLADVYDDLLGGFQTIGGLIGIIFSGAWLGALPPYVAVKALYGLLFFTLFYAILHYRGPFQEKKAINISLATALAGLISVAMPASWFAKLSIYLMIFVILLVYGIVLFFLFKWNVDPAASGGEKFVNYFFKGLSMFVLYAILAWLIPFLDGQVVLDGTAFGGIP